ncbi:uncharacterized protein LOC108665270 [Hyalella azteca]|uniref:Uncharacterized protein LOC108665270 n=1 Tax=Hyalella azteca TaxID=294128 RepID=A0A8B7N0Z0_HYAAZ|nr:uncharacterized protein LOC108665270 [Hyalella azteca]
MALGLVLAVLMVTEAVSVLPPIDPSLCASAADGVVHCASCLQQYLCQGKQPVPLPQCFTGTVCEEVKTNAAQCVPIASATACKCTSDICDEYNSNFSATCNAGGVTNIQDCTVANPGSGDCFRGDCIDCTNLGLLKPVYEVLPPACTVAYQCDRGLVSTSNPVECPTGQYVAKDGTCVSKPPVPCDPANLCTGRCPDLTNCAQYYFCDPNGGEPGGAYSCGLNSYFDPVTRLCETGSSSVCDPWTKCDLSAPATTPIATAPITTSPPADNFQV